MECHIVGSAVPVRWVEEGMTGCVAGEEDLRKEEEDIGSAGHHIDSGHADSAHIDLGRAGADHIGSDRVDSGPADSDHVDSAQAGSGHVGSGRTDFDHAGFGRVVGQEGAKNMKKPLPSKSQEVPKACVLPPSQEVDK